jgi:hypothetical protein
LFFRLSAGARGTNATNSLTVAHFFQGNSPNDRQESYEIHLPPKYGPIKTD